MIDISGTPESRVLGQKLGAPGQSAPENTSMLLPFGSVLDGLMQDHPSPRSGAHITGHPPASASISAPEALPNGIVSVLDTVNFDHSEPQPHNLSPAGSGPTEAWKPESDPSFSEMDAASEQSEGMPEFADLIDEDGIQKRLGDADLLAAQATATSPQLAKSAKSATQDEASIQQSTEAMPSEPLKLDASLSLSMHDAAVGEDTDLIETTPKKPVLLAQPVAIKPQLAPSQPSAFLALKAFSPAPSAAQVAQHAMELIGNIPGSLLAGADSLQTNALGIAAPTTPQQGTAALGQIVQSASPAIPMHGPNWVSPMVSGPVVSLFDAAGGRMVIDIAPEELGRLTISLTVQGDTAIVRFQTDTPEAARILVDAERQLSSELARFGMTLAEHDATPDRKQSGGRAAHHSGQPGMSDELPDLATNPAVAASLVNIIA